MSKCSRMRDCKESDNRSLVSKDERMKNARRVRANLKEKRLLQVIEEKANEKNRRLKKVIEEKAIADLRLLPVIEEKANAQIGARRLIDRERKRLKRSSEGEEVKEERKMKNREKMRYNRKRGKS